MNCGYIFRDAFETFKVFETIPFEQSGLQADSNSKTIWQILNHLTKWQEYQIHCLNNSKHKIDFNESDSWIEALKPSDQFDWNQKISEFNHQIHTIQQFTASFNFNDSKTDDFLKIIQDSSTHLSFHLGEIIFLARLNKVYPQVHEMNDFLAKK